MKIMKKILFSTALLAASTVAALAQTEVTLYRPGITSEGITYYLPATELVVTVQATRTDYFPGDFAAYASPLLRLNNVTGERRTEWRIDSVSLATVGVPDSARVFSIKLRRNTPAPLASLTANGILLSVNAQVPEPAALSPLPKPTTHTDSLAARDYLTETILASGSTQRMAQLTADEIYDIRESRSSLSKGQADFMPKDGQQLSTMLQSLNRQEQALLQLFKGTERTTTQSYRYRLLPRTLGSGKMVALRFSRWLGPLEADNLAGEPIYVQIEPAASLPAASSPDPKQKAKEMEDLRYVVPAMMNVSIVYKGRPLLSAQLPMAQFGYVEHLGNELLNKKMGTRVFLSPTTGALTKLEAEEAKP